jgi:hypothetical protein
MTVELQEGDHPFEVHQEKKPPLTSSGNQVFKETCRMHRLCKYYIIGGFLSLLLLVAGPAHSKPWRQIDHIPASRITWKGHTGHAGNDKTRMYKLTARGSLSLPGLGAKRYPASLEQRIAAWLAKHPKARALPIEAYPFFSNSVARVYIWVVDGTENLNIDLVREGFINASSLLPILRTADLYISARELAAFRKEIKAAEIAAAKANKGIWADPYNRAENPPGSLEFPGIMELEKLERMAERSTD